MLTRIIDLLHIRGGNMDNMTNTQFRRKLPVPKEIKEQMPLSKEAEIIKDARDAEIAKVMKLLSLLKQK